MWKFLVVLVAVGVVLARQPKPPISNCNELPKTGMCRASFRRYFFNTTSNWCEKFIYGGCHSNGNNYLTFKDCNLNCSCKQPLKVGPCEAAITRYYYDSILKKCVEFSWGGCLPNANNFMSLDACLATCQN